MTIDRAKPKVQPPRERAPELVPGDQVLTPTNRRAVVLHTDDRRREVTLRRLDDGEALHLREKHVRRTDLEDGSVMILTLDEEGER